MPRPIFDRILCVLILLLAVSPSLRGQTIEAAWSKSLTAMKEQKWEEAHEILSAACDKFDPRAPDLQGPKFGWFWYHKGYCELKLQKWEDAIASFRRCYTKYSNKGMEAPKEGQDLDVSFNFYEKMALLKWGDAARGAGQYNLALEKYEQFLKERAKRDTYDRGALHISMAICHLKQAEPDFPKALQHLETAITNKEKFRTPDAGIMVGFRALAEAVIATGNEPVLLDFLAKNRGYIRLEPFLMHRYSDLFLALGAKAVQANLARAAFELYALIPSTPAAIDDLQTRLQQIGAITRPFPDPPLSKRIIDKAAMQADLESLKKQWSSGDPAEATALAAIGYVHERSKNIRGAFACHEMLQRYYPDSAKRERNLYNLVRTAALIGKVLITAEFGAIFLEEFPDSEQVESVRSMMLTSLFLDGEYAKCLEVATKMLPGLTEPSKQHDICLHVLGGSYYYTGEYEKARKRINEHVEKYPESDFVIASNYFQASNLSRLQEWNKAAEFLDVFLEKYPDPGKNRYLSFALYDRANCHYASDELDPALVKLNRIEKEFPQSQVRDMAFNLKGNIFQLKGQDDQAEQAYLQALQIAEGRGNRHVAGESLSCLVRLLGAEKRGNAANPRVPDAIPYYEKFWAEHGETSPFKSQVAVSGMHALTAAGRRDDALERLQAVIVDLARAEGGFGLEEAINSYTEAYLEHHSAEELKEHYYFFPGIDARNREAQAILRVAVITAFEDVLKQAEKDQDEGHRRDAQAMIKVLFEDLKNEFEPSRLSNYVLVRLGDYLRRKTRQPQEAIPFYREVLSREDDQSQHFSADFGLADVLGNSRDPAEIAEALESLERVAKKAPKKKQRELALYRIVTVLAAKGDWKGVAEWAKEYLTTDGYRTYAGYVSLLLADAYREQGMSEDAIAAYSNIVGAFAGFIKVSAPSMRHIMELSWKRDRRGDGTTKPDRQMAYESGWKYCDTTKHIRSGEQITEEESELWDEVEALVQRYEDDPSVMKMEEVKKLEEKRRRARRPR